jgi:hypothetical protein
MHRCAAFLITWKYSEPLKAVGYWFNRSSIVVIVLEGTHSGERNPSIDDVKAPVEVFPFAF